MTLKRIYSPIDRTGSIVGLGIWPHLYGPYILHICIYIEREGERDIYTLYKYGHMYLYVHIYIYIHTHAILGAPRASAHFKGFSKSF